MASFIRNKIATLVLALCVFSGVLCFAPMASASESQTTITGGTLDWGIKDSFIKYLNMPFAAGEVVPADGATAGGTGFVWPVKKGEFDGRTVSFGGSVHATAHGDILDLKFSDPQITVDGSTGTLSAVVVGREFKSTTEKGDVFGPERIVLADLSDARLDVTETAATISFTGATITSDGARAFGGFYQAGEAVNVPTVSLTLAQVVEDPVGNEGKEETGEGSGTATQPEDNESPDGATEDNQGGSSESTSEGAGATVPSEKLDNDEANSGKTATTSKEAAGSKTNPSAIKKCIIDQSNLRATAGSFVWGVKDSFNTYIRGSIAKGKFTTAGGTRWTGSDFVFPLSGAIYDSDARIGTFYFSGSVSYTGHGGVLHTTLGNPVVKVNGNTASLFVNVRSNDVSGKQVASGSQVHFANATLSQLYLAGGELSIAANSVTLTAAGANAFAQFYSAGEAIDTFTVSAAMKQAETCDPVTGEKIIYDAFGHPGSGHTLARTGSSAMGVVFIALVMMTAGSVLLLRRHL